MTSTLSPVPYSDQARTVGIRFIWNWDFENSLLRYGWNNGGILGILSGLIILEESLRIGILVLKMGEGLNIVRIFFFEEDGRFEI